MKSFLFLLVSTILTIVTATPLKGAQSTTNLRHRVLHKTKTPEPTPSPTFAPSLSPTECNDKGCDKDDKKLNKLNSADETDDTIIIAFDDTTQDDDAIVIEFDDAYTPSPAVTPAPTFMDDFVGPTEPPVSEETGEPVENNGIGISVDVGGNENIVDVTVIITQNGGDVDVSSGDGGDDGFEGDDEIVYDDDSYYGSMSMGNGDDSPSDDYQVEPVAEEMEKPEDVTEISEENEEEDENSPDTIAFDDDFSTFFDTKKKDKPAKVDNI